MIYYVRDTQDHLNSYYIDEDGTKITIRDILLGKWNEIVEKAHVETNRKRVLQG
jgi:hypothetical protein